MPLSQLFERSGLELSEFSEAIEALRAANLIEVRQVDNDRIVELTESGRALS
jgi:DNA-binding MarR family transcriptional regulator